MSRKKISIVGTVGVPGKYGGFETLAENLVLYHYNNSIGDDLIVYCSASAYSTKNKNFCNAELRYVNLNANGWQSVLYDMVSMVKSAKEGSDVILLLGVSGAFLIPILKKVKKIRVVTNIDGIEWKREKWGRVSRAFLRFSEYMAVKFSDKVIADNYAISEYVYESYSKTCEMIPYGGDHSISSNVCMNNVGIDLTLPDTYVLSLCRIEPENNIELILRSWAEIDFPLVFVGNWSNSDYGRRLKKKYEELDNVFILDPIYDPFKLQYIRRNAVAYVHGHSAGGTNPSLVEMMHYGIPVLAYDCSFNRCTTENKAVYFRDSSSLKSAFIDSFNVDNSRIGKDMKELAEAKYTWAVVGEQYFNIL